VLQWGFQFAPAVFLRPDPHSGAGQKDIWVEYVIVAIATLVLALLTHAAFDAKTAGKVFPVLFAGFTIRLLIHLLAMRSGAFVYGKDNFGYERVAVAIAKNWQDPGFQHLGPYEASVAARIMVPCYVFAAIIYICGGPAPLACTSIVALIACALCIVVYKFAKVIGADDRAAYRLLVLIAFMPSLMLYTSDMFKDGFCALFTIGILWLISSNARQFHIKKLLVLALSLLALWYVRQYMVFACAIPLFFGLLGTKYVLSGRNMMILAGIATAGLILLFIYQSGTTVDALLTDLGHGQATEVRNANARDDSGVAFHDNADPWGAIGPKLLYTVFSPFPWTGGSLALQLGKIDVFLWYYLIFCSIVGFRGLWSHDRKSLLTLLLFIVPSTIAYATSMANIGLIFRQRIPIVIATSLLAALAWSRTDPTKDMGTEPAKWRQKRSAPKTGPPNGSRPSGITGIDNGTTIR
jgi:hypothetical protein